MNDAAPCEDVGVSLVAEPLLVHTYVSPGMGLEEEVLPLDQFTNSLLMLRGRRRRGKRFRLRRLTTEGFLLIEASSHDRISWSTCALCYVYKVLRVWRATGGGATPHKSVVLGFPSASLLYSCFRTLSC